MIRFGLVGCGRISGRHVHTLSRLSGAQLCAVSDIHTQKMTAVIQHYAQLVRLHQRQVRRPSSTCRRYQNYTDLLHDPALDAVIVCTSSSLHAQVTKQALAAGKHVMVEKPLALSLKDADDVIEMSHKCKRHVLVCHQMRYRPLCMKVKNLLQEEALGKVHLGVASIRIHRSRQYYEEAPWRGTWLQDGGMLLNQGIHLVDLLQWLLSDVQKVYGEICRGSLPKETEDIALGLLTFQNEARGVIEANTLTYPRNLGYSLSLFGEHGTIVLSGKGLEEVVRWSYANQRETAEDLSTLTEDQHEHEYMYHDFLQAVSGQQDTVLVNAVEGKKAVETVFGLYQSAQKQLPQTLPPTSFDLSKMKEGR